MSIIDNMNLSNREQLIAELEKANQPNEQQMAAMQAQEQRAMEQHLAQLDVLKAQAEEFRARANKYNKEAELYPARLEIERMEAAADINNDAADDFERVMRVSEQSHKQRMDRGQLALKEIEIRNKNKNSNAS